MLPESCPTWNSPLFDWKGEIWCPQCNKPVITKAERKLVVEIETATLLKQLEETLVNRISHVEREIRFARDPSHLQMLSSSLCMLLAPLESVKRLRKKKR